MKKRLFLTIGFFILPLFILIGTLHLTERLHYGSEVYVHRANLLNHVHENESVKALLKIGWLERKELVVNCGDRAQARKLIEGRIPYVLSNMKEPLILYHTGPIPTNGTVHFRVCCYSNDMRLLEKAVAEINSENHTAAR
jgi:hypothetical protein